MLVLAPTRELAVQIQQECQRFGSSSKIKNTCIYGGVPKQQQVWGGASHGACMRVRVYLRLCVYLCACMPTGEREGVDKGNGGRTARLWLKWWQDCAQVVEMVAGLRASG